MLKCQVFICQRWTSPSISNKNCLKVLYLQDGAKPETYAYIVNAEVSWQLIDMLWAHSWQMSAPYGPGWIQVTWSPGGVVYNHSLQELPVGRQGTWIPILRWHWHIHNPTPPDTSGHIWSWLGFYFFSFSFAKQKYTQRHNLVLYVGWI